MDRDPHRRRNPDGHDCARIEKIVDDLGSSYPNGLLRWLKDRLKLTVPVNNPHFNPIPPTTAT